MALSLHKIGDVKQAENEHWLRSGKGHGLSGRIFSLHFFYTIVSTILLSEFCMTWNVCWAIIVWMFVNRKKFIEKNFRSVFKTCIWFFFSIQFKSSFSLLKLYNFEKGAWDNRSVIYNSLLLNESCIMQTMHVPFSQHLLNT